jgi:hypothetical protein
MYKREERILINNPTPHLHGSIASIFDFEDGGDTRGRYGRVA